MNNIKKAGGVVGRRHESTDTVYHRLVTNEPRTIFVTTETHPLRPEFDNRRIDRSDRFRIPLSKTKRYLRSVIPKGHSDRQSTSRQINTKYNG